MLLAHRLAPAHLGPALAHLPDALKPDGCELDSDTTAYFLTVTPVLHGDWELRGLLSPETGALLSTRLQELHGLLRLDQPQIPTARRPRTYQPVPQPQIPLEPDPDPDPDPDPGPDHLPQEPPRLLPVSQQRHDALTQLLRDSALTAVLLDAAGNPVGASSTHRSATPRERHALRAQWGHTCAVAGCHRTATVPHHVQPWWKTTRTRLRDLAPICTSCHHDLHEGRRTLRLRDGRLLNDQGWVTATNAA